MYGVTNPVTEDNAISLLKISELLQIKHLTTDVLSQLSFIFFQIGGHYNPIPSNETFQAELIQQSDIMNLSEHTTERIKGTFVPTIFMPDQHVLN